LKFVLYELRHVTYLASLDSDLRDKTFSRSDLSTLTNEVREGYERSPNDPGRRRQDAREVYKECA
jgi:hypothetical protein